MDKIRQQAKIGNVFSGDFSAPFWDAVNQNKKLTIKQKDLLYSFGCYAQELESERDFLKKVLFVIGEIALCEFDDTIVGIVDSVLKGYKIETEEEFLSFKSDLMHNKGL